ncbi:acid protease [Gloeopeniophorella convolvens]|nr:acid protease [Gloeopeniophorella convolvens]
MRGFALLFLPLLADLATAITIPVQGFPRHPDHLSKRANVTGTPLQNSGNTIYAGNITLGGTSFNVILDTGSSDLWVAGNVPGTVNSGKSASISYAIGRASGNINYATLGFDGFTVDNQAYILVTDTSTFSSALSSNNIQGLMGLGPNAGSVVESTVGNSTGDSPLFRVFAQNKTTQNFISFQLDRKGDPTDSVTGQITISEVISGFENITSQPKLNIKDAPVIDANGQHWAVLSDGVIGPDGQSIDIESIVPHVSDGKLVAVFDTGFTLSQVPRKLSDAIYGRVQGANYSVEDGYWTLPCDQELNLTFKFGGQTYPVHPLDVSTSDLGYTDASGNTRCVGSFQPITTAFSLLGEYDIILGMSFLRNTYTLIDFGNYVDDTSNDRGDPYVQLLSLTDASSAHSDFVKVRLNGQDTTGSPSKTLLPASQESHSPESAGEKKQHIKGAVERNWPYILIGCLVFVLAVVGCCIWRCCCARRGKPVRGFVQNPYQTIQEPAPPPMHMQPLGNAGAQYADPYGPHA